MNMYFVYILKCSDNSYYTGSTNNLQRRLNEHNTGKYKGYIHNQNWFSERSFDLVVICRRFSHLKFRKPICCRYTSTRRPVKLVYSQEFHDVKEAIANERKIKGWSRKKKEALINGDYNSLHSLSECKNESHYKNKSMG